MLEHSFERPLRSYNIYIADRAQRLMVGGQPLMLQPGDFMLADSELASTITADEPHATIGLTVPESFLRTYVPDPERSVGVRFSGSDGLSRILSLLLRDVRARMSEAGSNAPARRAQIRHGIQRRLRDPEFSVKALARELGLSTRYMQMIFNDGDESICQYIRNQRLEGCRRELADPQWREHSVTAIAFRWGFNSAAHFCRAFRARYSISPSRFREQSLGAVPA